MLNLDELYKLSEQSPLSASKPTDAEILAELHREVEGETISFPWQLTDMDLWGNYTDDTLYELDKAVRAFLAGTQEFRRNSGKQFKTTVPLVFLTLFGRPAEPKDSSICRYLHRILKYYATSYSGQSTLNGKRVNSVYRFSRFGANKKRPISLRLRLELCNDERTITRKSSRPSK